MKRALLVIDVQNEYFTGALPVSHPAGSLDHILAAMDHAAAAGILVVVIQHAIAAADAQVFVPHSQGWELHPEVALRPRNLLVAKNLPGSFTGTGLEDWLRAAGVDTIAICGYMTQMCCDTTARQAFHRGFGVEFLSDATGTLDISNQVGSIDAKTLHRAVLITQAMRFSQVMDTAAWMAGAGA